MSVAPVNIQLSSLPSTVSASTGAATLTQGTSISSSPSRNQTHNLSSNASSTVTSTTASSPTSGINNSDPRSWFRPSWRKIQRVCLTLAKAFFAVAGTVVTYLALSATMWSSAKDYRDDCRSQNETYGYVSQACNNVLHAVLSRPLGLSMFVSESKEDQRLHLVRKDQLPLPHTSDDEAVSVAEALMVIAGMCVIGFLLAFLRPGPPAIKALIAVEPNQELTSDQYSTTTYTAWVDSSIPRPVVTFDSPLLGADPTNLRRRHTRNTTGLIEPNEEEECDWLPAGISTTAPETQQAPGLVPETFDSEDSDARSKSDPHEDAWSSDDISDDEAVQETQSFVSETQWPPLRIFASDLDLEKHLAPGLASELLDDRDSDYSDSDYSFSDGKPELRDFNNIHKTEVVQNTQINILQPCSAEILWNSEDEEAEYIQPWVSDSGEYYRHYAHYPSANTTHIEEEKLR